MILKQTIITTSLLSSFLCLGMEQNSSNISLLITTLNEVLSLDKQPINTPTTYYERLVDFEKKWGYQVPDTLIKETIGNKSTYKVVHQTYTNQKNSSGRLIEVQDIDLYFTPNILSSEKITTDMVRINQINAEKEQLKKIISEKTIILEKIADENKNLRNSIEELKQKPQKIKKEITSTQDSNTQKEQNVISKKTKSSKKKKNLAQRQQTVTVKITDSTPQTMPTQYQLFTGPTINPTIEDLQKKRSLLKILFKRYNAKSESQLKIKLAQECREKKSFGQGSIMNGCTWEYMLPTNSLVINTNGFRDIKDCWEDID